MIVIPIEKGIEFPEIKKKTWIKGEKGFELI